MAKIITSDKWTGQRTDRRILGSFIESGFGRQVTGMWSEMIYNRSFREVPPYKQSVWDWIGADEAHYRENVPCWHSGYEENDWESVGAPELRRTLGSLTFKGLTTRLVENKVEGEACGLKQQGIHLQKGREYVFRLYAGRRGRVGEKGLNGFGDFEHSNVALPLKIRLGNFETDVPLTTVCDKYEWKFTAEKTEIATLSITFNWQGIVALVCVSLMPADNIDGWRRDVVAAIREAGPSVVRFPGGCFVSFYEWEKTIGDRDTREPVPSFYWGGLEENDVGLDEFLRLSEECGFAPQICFNMMSSTPFKARQLVEYLNAPADTGMGRLRMLNGHEKPYGVKLFEMDNETGRKWTACQYCENCIAFAREMRLADPDIELMFAAYPFAIDVLPDMLEMVGNDIQYVIYRDGTPEFVKKIMSILRTFNETHGTSLKLANTEWLPPCDSIEPFEDPAIPTDFEWRGEVTNDYRKNFPIQQISWNYALNGAQRIAEYISYGGEFALANFNNMCNTWGQNIIDASKDDCVLSNMGQVFSFFRRNFKPCMAAGTETDDARIFAQRIRCEDGDGLYVINHAGVPVEAELPAGEWRCVDGLSAETRISPHGAKPCKAEIKNGSAILPALSVTFLMQEKTE